jgi:hypothetical protein
MCMRRIQSCVVWLFLSATCAFTGFAKESETHVSNCAASPAIHHAVESTLLGLGWASPGSAVFESLRCFPPASMSETLAVKRVRKDLFFHTMELTLSCVPKEACLPFLVSLPDVTTLQLLQGGNTVRREPQPSAHSLGVSEALRQKKARPAAVVVPGQILTLVWEQASLQLTRKVICLDRGDVGDEVRTRPVGVGHVVRARVIDAGRVKAIL